MTVRAGKDFRVQIQYEGEWYSLPGERSSSLKIAVGQVDTSDKDDRWRNLSPCGVKTADIKVNGFVCDNSNKILFNLLMNSAINGDIIVMRVLSSGEANAEHSYLVVGLNLSGEHNGAEQYDIDVASADAEPPPPAIVVHADIVPPSYANGILTATASSSYPGLTYHWDFGNGETSDGGDVSSYYEYPGSYTITLTVYEGAVLVYTETWNIDLIDDPSLNYLTVLDQTDGHAPPGGLVRFTIRTILGWHTESAP